MPKRTNSNPQNRESHDFLSGFSKKFFDAYGLNPMHQALRITYIYSLIGSLWILLSDKLVEFLFKERSIILVISIVKGWVYVLITSVLIFLECSRGIIGIWYKSICQAVQFLRCMVKIRK